MNTFFLVFGLLHDMRSEFTDDVSELTVGPVLTGHKNNQMSKLLRASCKNQRTICDRSPKPTSHFKDVWVGIPASIHHMPSSRSA